MMIGKKATIEFSVGTDTVEAVIAAYETSGLLKCPVYFDFNGVAVKVDANMGIGYQMMVILGMLKDEEICHKPSVKPG